MDTNKSAYKLNGICPIYYLNLDGQPKEEKTLKTNLITGKFKIMKESLLTMVGMMI
jgi:hypothetical protein